MLKVGELRFVAMLRHWPRTDSIETYLDKAMADFVSDADTIRDDIAATRILAICLESRRCGLHD